MTLPQTPAEAFPPGEYLRDELEERGWTVTEFADIIGRPVQAVSEILNAKKSITPDTALSLSEALGTSPELWLNLQTAYQLHQRRSTTNRRVLSPVARRARLRDAIPLAEVRSRGWIPDTDDLDLTEAAVCELLEIRSLDQKPAFALAARRSNTDEPVTIKQSAWLGYIRQRAKDQEVAAFDVGGLAALAARLPRLMREGPSQLPRLPSLFAKCGVRLVFAEGLRGGKLDGAVTFLDDGRPVIGLTTRGNRFDSLVHTLLHECAHLTLGHINSSSHTIIDNNLKAKSDDPREAAANEKATAWRFPAGFRIEAVSVPAVIEASDHYGVHPSMVIGQLQWETERWSLYRAHIPKVRPELEDAGLLS
ncbi:MAG: HigA family addiction module antitoxin [bacterium]|nr:HigA family addiction module antitoxin [bacterium]